MQRFWRALGWFCVGVSVLGLCLRAADLRGAVPIAQALLPVFGIATVALAVIAVVVRRNWFALVAGTLALTYLAIGGVSALPRTVPSGAEDLVVLSANVEFGQGEVPAVRAAADGANADVLVLTEVTPRFLERLEADGLTRAYPHRAGRARDGAGGTVILSRVEMRELDPDENDLAFDQPVVELRHHGKSVELRGVHTFPPLLSGSAEWRRSLYWLQRWREAQHPDRPLIMAGDFNASSAHPAFRDLKGPMTDAQQAAGRGWEFTWPADRLVPFVSIDHVLVRRLEVVDFGTARVAGSDHRAVWARLRVG